MSDPCDLTAIAHWMERYEREKARAEKAEAALEAENLGAKAEQGRLADALAAARRETDELRALLLTLRKWIFINAYSKLGSETMRKAIDAALAAPAAGPSDSGTDVIFNALVRPK